MKRSPFPWLPCGCRFGGVKCDHCGWRKGEAIIPLWWRRSCPECRQKPIVSNFDLLMVLLIYVAIVFFTILHYLTLPFWFYRWYRGKAFHVKAQCHVNTGPTHFGEMPDLSMQVRFPDSESYEKYLASLGKNKFD